MNKIKININNSQLIFLIILLSIFKIGTSFLIPLNILPNANLDDALFYRLAENISNGNWLGAYENSTLIKGFAYPLFLATAIHFHIPVRILEGLLICISSAYFIFLFRGIFKNQIIILVFFMAIFYPYHYGTVDFRILRDMIYSPLLLILFTSLLFLIKSIRAATNNFNYLHIVILSTTFFLFTNTREEGIWILPAIIFTTAVLFFCGYKKDRLLYLIKLSLFGLFIFVMLGVFLSRIHEKYYHSPIINIWKDKNFQSGFGSLQRLSKNNNKLDFISKDNWEQFYKVSPAAASLKKYINSPVYENWIPISCNTLLSLGYDMDRDSGCPNEVVSGYILFALNDVLWAAGKRTPDEISRFMELISNEIDFACNRSLIQCNRKPPSVLPAQLDISKINFYEMSKLFIEGLTLIFHYQNQDFDNYFLDQDIQKTMLMRASLRARLFDIGRLKFQTFEEKGSDERKLQVISGDYGLLDSVKYQARELIISGYFYPSADMLINSVEVYINGHIACTVPRGGLKTIIQHGKEKNIRFECIVPFEFETSNPLAISAYVLEALSKVRYKLKNDYIVDISLSNKFNQDCYLFSNLDVKYYVDKGVFTADEHFKKYGIYENRPCAPINSIKLAQHNFQEEITRYADASNSFFSTVFMINSVSYSYFIKLIPFIFIILLLAYILGGKFNYLVVLSILIFLLLFLSRVSLISLFSYLGIAPISALYMASGFFSFFVAGVVGFAAALNEGGGLFSRITIQNREIH